MIINFNKNFKFICKIVVILLYTYILLAIIWNIFMIEAVRYFYTDGWTHMN